MLFGIHYGPSLNDKTSGLLLKDAKERGGVSFDSTPLTVKEDGVVTAEIPDGQHFELDFLNAGGKYAVEVGFVGANRITQFPVISEGTDLIRIRSLITVDGEREKLVMTDKSVEIGYRIRLVEPYGSNVDDVLRYDGVRENPSLADVLAGRTLNYGHDTAKLSEAAIVTGTIRLVLPGTSASVMEKWEH